jgi:hypothetical protein
LVLKRGLWGDFPVVKADEVEEMGDFMLKLVSMALESH